MSCGCVSGCGCGPQVVVTQARGCTTITVNNQAYTWCDGSHVTCTEQADGSHLMLIDGVPCIIPRSPTVVCRPTGIEIDGVLCQFPTVSVTGSNGVTVTQPTSQVFVAQIEPVGAVSAICSNVTAKNNLVDCVLSNQAGNSAVLGSDGAIYVPPIPAATTDVNVQSMVLTGNNLVLTETDGATHTVNLSAYVNAADVNVQSLTLSAANILTITETDGSTHTVNLSAYVNPAPAADVNVQSMVLTGNNLVLTETDGATHTVNLSAYVNATDVNVQSMVITSNNLVLTETDGSTHTVDLSPYINPAAVVIPDAAACASPTDVRGKDAGGTERFFDLDAIKSYAREDSISLDGTYIALPPDLPPEGNGVGSWNLVDTHTVTITNPSTCRDMAVKYSSTGRTTFVAKVTQDRFFADTLTVYEIDGFWYGGPVVGGVLQAMWNNSPIDLEGARVGIIDQRTTGLDVTKTIGPGATTTLIMRTYYGRHPAVAGPTGWGVEDGYLSVFGVTA